MSISFARNRLIALAFTAGLSGALGCGGNVANDTATVGSSAGGSTSNITNQNSSGGSTSTGGSTSFNDRCNGMFSGRVCSSTSVQAAQSCDTPLEQSPAVPAMVQVAIDCQRIPLAPGNIPDAGNVDGFAIDYSRDPAHLILLGASCEQIYVSGSHTVDVIQECIPAD